MKHLDLFSGIGGFALAGQWVGGIETTQFVEIDKFCQRVLAKNFPGVPIHDDVKTFSANAGNYELITAGFPCQPHSQAGKRKASKDDRDLWPELFRVICEVRPKWIVLENVPGLLSSESGRFFGVVLRDLAQAGFDAEWRVISCADLGGSHRRDRVWVVAYATEFGRKGRADSGFGEGMSWTGIQAQSSRGDNSDGKWPDSDTDGAGFSTRVENPRAETSGRRPSSLLKRFHGSADQQFTAQPTICGGDDGIPTNLDGLNSSKIVKNYNDRGDRVKALGNSIVPQVAMIPLQRVLDLAAARPDRPKPP
jgi:DNA (cytosine-5)-methyltransferase 1